MAWTKEQQQYCEYTICTVESGCDYAAVNMSDPITLGIGQFYAYNAAALMERLRDNASASFDKLSGRLKMQWLIIRPIPMQPGGPGFTFTRTMRIAG